MILDNLHWLRPWWLLALLPALALLLLAWRQQRLSHSAWRAHIDPHLLAHLLQQQPQRQRRWPLLLIAVSWLAAVVALAGPVWQRIELPLYQQTDPTVIVLNLSPAMTATDETPDRLSRARHKSHDLIEHLKGSQVALVIYADSPFVAAPLTDDGQVILNMLPELSGDLMPPLGDRADLALTQAVALLTSGGASYGRIILITNGLGDQPRQTLAAAAAAHQQGFQVNVLGVGSDAGVQIHDRRGRSYLSRRDQAGLEQLASAGGGHYAALSAGDGDWQSLLTTTSDELLHGQQQASELKADHWQENGHWLLLLPLLLAPLAFRKGWLALLITTGLGTATLLTPAPAAAGWRDWWQTPDQQASDHYAQGDYQAAQQQFQDPAWAASARYQAGDYQQAAKDFAALGNADGLYNAANALARAGNYQQALATYDQALKADPDNQDATFNRELVAKLLKQQQQDSNQQSQNGDSQQQGNGQQAQNGDNQQQQGNDQQSQNGDSQQQQANDQQAQNGDSQQQQASDQQSQNGDSQQQQASNQQSPNGDSQQQQASDQQAGQQQLQQQLDQALAEQPQPQGEEQPSAQAATASNGQPMTAEEQSRQQLLRSIPDDPTGLLRARIYQHYANQRNR